MAHFVIAGKADCRQFIQAIKIADFLEEHLPDMVIEKKEFLGKGWITFLLGINEANKWFITESPVIWKEFSVLKNKPHLIGGLSEFWEYVDDYYGLHNFFDMEIIEKLRLENLKLYRLLLEKKEKSKFVLGIYGFHNQYAQMLLPELFSVPNLLKLHTSIKIYDQEASSDPEVEQEIETVIKAYQEEIISCINFKIELSTSLTELIRGTDLLLITENYHQRDSEDKTAWLERCSFEMSLIADQLNEHGKKQLKIVCAHSGPVCFTATVLSRFCNFRRIRDIVAITAHEGLKALRSISKSCDIPISNLGAPPVWGFVGLDHFIDANGVLVLQETIRPYRRALKNIERSTLPQRKIWKELRFLSCNVKRKDIENDLINRCNLYQKLKVVPVLPLLRATLHFLEMWHSEDKNGVIISLGISSTGAFGIPQNIIFSQPVVLQNGSWLPFEDMPILEQSRIELLKCIKFSEYLLKSIEVYF